MIRPEPPVTPLLPDQRAAATAPIGPIIILGGAGTGRTHTICARIAILLKIGEPASSIACLTHSPGAPYYIRNKVGEFLRGDEGVPEWFMGTPQQLALELLRSGGMEALGRPDDFTVWQREDAQEYICGLLDPSSRDHMRIHGEAGRILRWLDQAGLPGGVPPDKPEWLDVGAQYEEGKRGQNVLDPGDLIRLFNDALEQCGNFRDRVARPLCRHLLVDDFQDLRFDEYRMVTLLAGPERSITVSVNLNEGVRMGEAAGDRALETLRLEYPPTRRRTCTLGLNMRTTETIGEALNRSTADPAMEHLSEETHRYFRDYCGPRGALLPMAPADLLVFEGRSADMYRHIFDRTDRFLADGYALEDIACIVQDVSILDQLRVRAVSRGMDYTMLGAPHRERDRDVACIVGLLTSLLNTNDVMAFRDATRVGPHADRPVDWVDATRLARMADELHGDLIQSAKRYRENPLLDEGLRSRLRFFADAWDSLHHLLTDPSTRMDRLCWRAVALVEEAQGVAHRLREKAQVQRLLALAEERSRILDFQVAVYDPREELKGFLDSINAGLGPDPLNLEKNDLSGPRRGITFITVAAARGLEWPVVWAVGASDHVLPGKISSRHEPGMRAAQRLFHVWSTRARDRLLFCHAVRSGPDRNAKPSRFLKPIAHLLRYTVVPAPAPRH